MVSFTTLLKKKLHLTPAPDTCTWHLTPDMWDMTCDAWWGVNILSKFQLPSTCSLGFTVLWRFWTKGWILMNHKRVYGTAPATPGPVDNRASTTSSTIFFCKLKKIKCHTWHVTDDTGYVTGDTWYVANKTRCWSNILSKCQLSLLKIQKKSDKGGGGGKFQNISFGGKGNENNFMTWEECQNACRGKWPMLYLY